MTVCKQKYCTYAKLNCLKIFNFVQKMNSGLFKNVIFNMFLEII